MIDDDGIITGWRIPDENPRIVGNFIWESSTHIRYLGATGRSVNGN